MNYYEHHLGDYAKDAGHLSMLEHGAYRCMLDLCYATEKPLPLDREKLNRLVRANSDEEKQAVSLVLVEFFDETPEGWMHKRVREEIKKASARIKAARTNGKKGGRPKTQRDTQRDAIGLAKQNPDLTQVEPRSKLPSTTSHLPPPKKEQGAQRSRGSRLLAGWRPDVKLQGWAAKERPDLDIEQTIARFCDHWTAAPGSRGVKLDWDATFRNWVRNEKLGTRAAALPLAVAQKLGQCPCGAAATVRVGGKPRCNDHVRNDLSTAAKAA